MIRLSTWGFRLGFMSLRSCSGFTMAVAEVRGFIPYLVSQKFRFRTYGPAQRRNYNEYCKRTQGLAHVELTDNPWPIEENVLNGTKKIRSHATHHLWTTARLPVAGLQKRLGKKGNEPILEGQIRTPGVGAIAHELEERRPDQLNDNQRTRKLGKSRARISAWYGRQSAPLLWIQRNGFQVKSNSK